MFLEIYFNMDIGSLFKSPFNDPTSVGRLATLFVNIAFVLSGVILLIFFIMGGIGMIASAGSGDPGKAAQAQKTVTSALIGFVIVFASYFLVKLIGQLIGVNII